jgi:hypothetical protein
MKKRDVLILLLVCAFAVFCAGALHKGGSQRARNLMCTVNMQKVGRALSAYWDQYDGRMPNMNYSTSTGVYTFQNCVRTPYLYSVLDQGAITSGDKQAWLQLGCLFRSGVVTDGKLFYCPATYGAMDEYYAYSSPSPWGSSLDQQISNYPGNGNIWLRSVKGTAYWPQGKLMATGSSATLYNPYDGQLLGYPSSTNGWSRYLAGKPAPPFKASDLDIGKSTAVDNISQPDGFGGYKVDALFPDGHTNYQPVPKYDGKWLCPYMGGRPSDVVAAEWYGDGSLWDNTTMPANYMSMLVP